MTNLFVLAFVGALIGTTLGFARADEAIPLSPAELGQLEKYLGSGVVGAAVPATTLPSPESFFPKLGGSHSFQVTNEKGKSTTEIHIMEQTTDASFAPGWHYKTGDDQGAFFKKGDGESLLTVAQQDFEQKVLTRFTPGEPMIIGGAKPGSSQKFNIKVDVSDLSDLDKVSHTGTLNVTYTYIGMYKVSVPAGTYDAALIKWEYDGKVGPATIKETTYRFLAPGAGMVAMVENRSISALLIYNDHAKLGKVLVASQ